MKEEDIRKLEPKYMGNTRHLTPGEAGEILHDPDNAEGKVDWDDVTPIPMAAPFTNNMMSSGIMNNGLAAPAFAKTIHDIEKEKKAEQRE